MSGARTPIPTLAGWAGGPSAFVGLTRSFYEKVSADPTLAPVFQDMAPDHASHVARFLTEVFGGAKLYTEAGGTHAAMISRHLGRHLTETQRSRWMALLLETADEVLLPDDPEFRSALVGYIEWGSRLAVINSREGAAVPAVDLPMPAWSWGPPGGPFQD